MQKKLLTLLVLLITAATGAMATTVTWVTTDFYNTSRDTFTKYDVTVTTTNQARMSNYFYDSGVNTFTTTLGNFTKIEIVFPTISSPLTISGWNYEVIEAVQPYPEDDPEYWEYTSKLTWTGDAGSVSIQGNVNNIQSITFTIADAPSAPAESIDLTTTDNLTWTLASMPEYNLELEVEYETALALSETTDNSAALTEWDGYEADVTLTRTLSAGSWNTFAAPFSTAIPEGWTVKELTSATFADGTLTLNFANAASIEAGKPYLVKVAANTDLSATPFTGAIVSKDAQPFTSTDVDFIPTLGATTIPDGDTKAVLFLAAGNTLLNPSEQAQ